MTHPPVSLVRRWMFVTLGLLFVGLAGLGVVLPGLPATPFVLMASYFFTRSSPRLHGWLRTSRVFGGLLQDWERHRGVRRSVKWTSYLLIPSVVALSMTFGGLPLWANVVIAILAGVGLLVVYLLPVVPVEPA